MRAPSVAQAPLIDSLTVMRGVPGRCHFNAYKNVSIAVWVGQGNLDAIQLAAEVGREMAARHPRGHSSVHFILDGLPGPTPDAQPLFNKAVGARTDLACLAVILEGSGFWASGLRSLINNTHREENGASALRIATAIEPLMGWFSEQHLRRTGVELSALQLRDVLSHARQVGELAARG